MRTFVILAALFTLHARADSFSAGKPKLAPVKLQPKPALQVKVIKPIQHVAPKSTYRAKPEPIVKPMQKMTPVRHRPDKHESEMDDIKTKKFKPIRLKEEQPDTSKTLKNKKAPKMEPSKEPNFK